jgi:hypothetical protein
MDMKKSGIMVTFALAWASFAAHAQFLELNISADCNQDLQTFADGYDYPFGGTQLDAGGVPFGLSLLDNIPDTTGVVMAPADDQSYTFTVPSGTYATALYTLMNTAWGMLPGVYEGSIIVTGSGGETATLDLTEGVNIRDQYNGFFVNSLSDSTAVSTDFENHLPNPSGPVRLDRQELVLPSSFNGDTLASITFDGLDHGEPNGDPFLAGITLAVVPEPSPYLIFALGALVLGARFARPFQRD